MKLKRRKAARDGGAQHRIVDDLDIGPRKRFKVITVGDDTQNGAQIRLAFYAIKKPEIHG